MLRRLKTSNALLDAASLTAAKAAAVKRIKEIANQRILTSLPVWKQNNASMRAIELVKIKAEGGTLSAKEQTEETQLMAAAGWVKSVRAVSNTKEAEIDALTTVEAVQAYDFGADWPAQI